MNIGPSAQTITPRFADFVAAADARRRAAGAFAGPPPRPPDLLPLPEVRTHGGAGAGARNGYFDALDLDMDLPLPDLLERSTALAAATRTLRMIAAARGQHPQQALDAAEPTPLARLPAQNAADARSDFTTALRVTTEFGRAVTADIHVSKTEDGRWEIAAFDSETAGAGPFPYAAPPLFVMTAEFDPLRAEFVAANIFARAVSPRVLQMEAGGALFDRRSLGVAAALAAIAGILFLSREAWPLAGAAIAFVGVVALRIALRRLHSRDA